MHKAKVTTPTTPTTPKWMQGSTNNGSIGESFRVLYYGNASAGSVPFMWESQPGTPKHALTESSLPPLTPPPSYNQFNQKYNSPMQVIPHLSPNKSGFFRTFFLPGKIVRKTPKNLKHPSPSTFLSSSLSSSSSSGSSNLQTWQSTTPMSKTELRRVMKIGFEEDCHVGDSPTSTLCFRSSGGESKKSYRITKMKKAVLAFVRNGNA